MKITYRPKDGDPHKTSWNGVTFHANIPVENVKHPEIVSSAPTNPWFECEAEDGEKIDKKEQAAKVAAPVELWPDLRKKPKTPEEYRAYAIAWLNKVEIDIAAKDSDAASISVAAGIRQRWEREGDLRAQCGVGTDDVELLAKAFDPRIAKFDPGSKPLYSSQLSI